MKYIKEHLETFLNNIWIYFFCGLLMILLSYLVTNGILEVIRWLPV